MIARSTGYWQAWAKVCESGRFGDSKERIFFCQNSLKECQGWWKDLLTASWLFPSGQVKDLEKYMLFHEGLDNTNISASAHRWPCVARVQVSGIVIIHMQTKIWLWNKLACLAAWGWIVFGKKEIVPQGGDTWLKGALLRASRPWAFMRCWNRVIKSWQSRTHTGHLREPQKLFGRPWDGES